MAIRKLKARGIGRFELLSWLNEFLETDYTKIEHLADGIAYCQVFDVIFPGKVALHLVNFHATYEPEFERNLGILKKAFDACQVRKEIPMKKLVRGVFHEHFDFLNWIHDYVHRNCPDAARGYHAYARREEILSTQPKAVADVNVNLVPRFSMRNGLFQSAGPSFPEAISTESHHEDTDRPNSMARSTSNNDDAPPPLRSISDAEVAVANLRTALHTKLPAKRPSLRSAKKSLEPAPWSGPLQRLNIALEAELHGRIQSLDSDRRDIASLLAERNELYECLRDMDSALRAVAQPTDEAAVGAILSAPLPPWPFVSTSELAA